MSESCVAPEQRERKRSGDLNATLNQPAVHAPVLIGLRTFFGLQPKTETREACRHQVPVSPMLDLPIFMPATGVRAAIALR